MWGDSVRAAVGRSLERGRGGSPLSRAAERLWCAASTRRLRRPLHLPAGVCVVGVGGATLGGAGKTPLCIALAQALAGRGARLAVVGHGYRARAGAARAVGAGDAVAQVGDDALFAARALAGTGVTVVVADTRQRALDHAATLAQVVVVDGLLQAQPLRLTASILVADEATPLEGRCPPLGDLRAPWEAMREACDVVARVHASAAGAGGPDDSPHAPDGGGERVVRSRVASVEIDGCELPLADLAGRRVGLLLAIAHPERIEQAVRRAGIVPHRVVTLADHALDPAARVPAGAVDVWLTTARCRTKLPARLHGAAVGTLVHRLDVATLVEWLEPRLQQASPRHAVPARRGDASLAGSG